MEYIKKIYTQIEKLYPNNLKKQEKLKNDFIKWIKGDYGIPRTKEIRKIILEGKSFECFRCGGIFEDIFKSKVDNKLCKYCEELDDENGELKED